MTSSPYEIHFNKQTLVIEAGQTLADFLSRPRPEGRFVVALNDELVPEARWQQHEIQPGDRIDLVRPISGG